MTVALEQPGARGLPEVVKALRGWQDDSAPMQLHPGDLGWNSTAGPEATAAATRLWRREGRVLGIALADGSDVVRMTIAPDLAHDEELAQRLRDDLTDPRRAVLPEGRVAVEAPAARRLAELLREEGWVDDEPWTPLRRDLRRPVESPGVRVDLVGPEQAAERVTVHRAAFERSQLTLERWQAMTTSPAYDDARCLLAYDDSGVAVAAVTVWSAGPERPGLLEPMGVHRDHRGRGFGRAICLAAAVALQGLGSSSAIVCTLSSNVGGVATYRSAGFEQLPERRDLYRRA